MTPQELIASLQAEREAIVCSRICQGPYREHVDALLDAGFGAYTIERVMREKLGYTLDAATVRKHAKRCRVG